MDGGLLLTENFVTCTCANCAMFCISRRSARARCLRVPSPRPRARWLAPAPSADWDPSRKTAAAERSGGGATISLTLHLPEDAVLQIDRAPVGATLLEVLESDLADLSDVFKGGACGGLCNCSSAPPPPPGPTARRAQLPTHPEHRAPARTRPHTRPARLSPVQPAASRSTRRRARWWSEPRTSSIC